MVLNKKAFFFTSISILLISILMIGFRTSSTDLDIQRLPIIENRIVSVNEYVRELDYDYIPKAILVSSRNALRYYSEFVIERESFDDKNTMEQNLFTLMLNGTIKGNQRNPYSLINLLNNVTEMINHSKNVETIINYGNFSHFDVYQDNSTGPWKIAFNYSLNYTVISDIANWTISNKDYSIYVHIDNLPDPYLSINSNRDFERNITRNVNLTWDYNRFESYIENPIYVWSNISPNFLSRLYNSTEPAVNTGIHTIITPIEGLSSNDYKEKSFIDFCYYSDECDERLYNVTGITNATYPFKIDHYHLDFYGLRKHSTLIE